MSVLAVLGMFASASPPAPAPSETLVVDREDLEALRAEVRALRDSLDKRDQPKKSTVIAYGDAVHVVAGDTVDEAVAFGEDIRIDGTVTGDVTAVGGNVTIGPRGVVLGDAVAFGGRIRIEKGGTLRGNRVDVSSTPSSTPETTEPTEPGWLSFLYRRMVLLLSLAGAGVLVVGLFPARVHQIARKVEHNPVWSGLIGATFSVLLVVFAVLFGLLTVGLGLPVSFLGIALLAAAWLFGFVALCQVIGDRLPFAEKPHGRWVTFLVGMVLVSCVGSLPWVGMLVVFAASSMSVGAAVSSRFGTSRCCRRR